MLDLWIGRTDVKGSNVHVVSLWFCVHSVSERPTSAFRTLQTVPREGPGLLPERRGVLRHRDAERAAQALQVSTVLPPLLLRGN